MVTPYFPGKEPTALSWSQEEIQEKLEGRTNDNHILVYYFFFLCKWTIYSWITLW